MNFIGGGVFSRTAELGARSISGRADIDVRVNSGFTEVSTADFICKDLRLCRSYQVDGAASEAASGHPSAVVFGKALGCLHHKVQFFATHSIQVSQTLVRLPHQLAKPGEIPRAEGPAPVQYSLVFVNDMTTAFIDRFRQIHGMCPELIGRHIAQSAYTRIPLRQNL